MLRVSNAGFQIAYQVIGRGSGPGFLFAQSKVGWHRMGYAEALKDHGKVLVVDPRGYGDSSRARTEADYSLDAFCDDLLAAADAVGLDQFVAWGYSNTAALAVALAAKSDRVVGLICSGMDPLLNFGTLTSHVDNEVREAGEGDYLPDGHFDWRAARAFYRDYEAFQATLPSHVDIPAALVYGADDALVAPSVEQNRGRLERMGFTITALKGHDHQSCVEASSEVVAAALPAIRR